MPTTLDGSLAALKKDEAQLQQRIKAVQAAIALIERAANPLPYTDIVIWKAAVLCLEEAGEPLEKSVLSDRLEAGGAVEGKRNHRGNITKSIDLAVKMGRLAKFPGGKIGLPDWKSKD